ncbi:hypothetical protein MTR_2g028880 [Medicago truncatula]|uniref:Uncharacterized protein n=1 Tax=Medicago truncatula TaxID=3880 RepID=G7IFV7_MEDTR|nr:hypothetical protein MTR_2g028880 [Medicago truncatula]
MLIKKNTSFIYDSESDLIIFTDYIPPQLQIVTLLFKTCTWYNWMRANNQLSTWDAFTHLLEMRFKSSSYENHQATLFKLCQKEKY